MKDKLAQNPQNEPLSIPSIPQVRMTRRIAGEETLTGKNCESYFEDSIGLVPDWRKRGRVYEVPFGSLFSSKTVNLICAGRCVSNDDTMWDVLRVIPCCAVTGEAAGIAASLSDDFSALDVRALQGILQSRGVLLHRK